MLNITYMQTKQAYNPKSRSFQTKKENQLCFIVVSPAEEEAPFVFGCCTDSEESGTLVHRVLLIRISRC